MIGPRNLNIIAVLMGSILVIAPITAITIIEGLPSRGVDSCDSCHGGRYDLVIEDPVISSPSNININENGQVNVSVTVTADGTDSYYEFDMIVKLVSVNSKISVPSQVTFSDQRPSGSGQPYSWTRDLNFDITGVSGGAETIRAEATMRADHYGINIKRTDTASVIVVNDPPVLYSGEHDPQNGTIDTEFNFKIAYMDANGDYPSRIDLVLSGTRYPLIAEDGVEDSIATGENYSTSMKLPWGEHHYHFEASDGTDETRFPASGEIAMPPIPEPNYAPTLEDGDLDPFSGFCNETFRFSVTYQDLNGELPAGEGLVLILGEERIFPAMSQAGGGSSYLTDGNVSNGERYEIYLELPCGKYQYRFNATDGEFHVQTGPASGPVVTEEPYVDERISSPEEGQKFDFNSTINFSVGSFSTEDIENITYRWSSNISGYLGDEMSFSMVLPPGYHNITLFSVSSTGGRNSTCSVNIIVKEEKKGPDQPAIIGYSPEGGQIMDEGDHLLFEVKLDMNVLPDMNETYWKVDGNVAASGVEYHNFTPTHDDAGEYLLEFIVIDPGDSSIRESVEWVILVNDVKAPIIVQGEIITELGEFIKKDQLSVSLPVKDPSGRLLTVEWMIDNRAFPENGLTFELILNKGPWTHIGDHVLKATVINPDHVEKLFVFNYTMVEEILKDPEPETNDTGEQQDNELLGTKSDNEDGGRGLFSFLKGDLPGGIILIASALALILGIAWAVYVLIRPAKNSGHVKAIEWEE